MSGVQGTGIRAGKRKILRKEDWTRRPRKNQKPRVRNRRPWHPARAGQPPVFLLHDNPPADPRLHPIRTPGGLHPNIQKDAQGLMTPHPGLAPRGLERILELSAAPHTRMCELATD